MSSYTNTKRNSNPSKASALTPPGIDPVTKETQIKVDGFGQVIALLEVADPSFRESLIKRIAAKDPHLAQQIRTKLDQN